MIHFFIGTKAQLIKMAPLMIELRNRAVKFRYIDSGQHAEINESLRKVFDLPEPDLSLREGSGDIIKILGAIWWYLRYLSCIIFCRRWLRETMFPGGGVCLIHGDTVSALLGLQLARAAGLKVAHVEAGLRSFRLWDPFPEEMIRIYCMRRADMLFAPSSEAAKNLRKMRVRGEIVQVSGNTVVDALQFVETAGAAAPDEPYALATCHRLETISSRNRLEKVVALLNRAAEQWPVVFVLHKPTRRYLEKYGLTQKLSIKVQCCPMQDYETFVSLLTGAKLVLTDGGSIQEECGYLQKPCLILRMTTERPDGLGENAQLWKFDEQTTEDFLSVAGGYVVDKDIQLPCPTVEIVDQLCTFGFCS